MTGDRVVGPRPGPVPTTGSLSVLLPVSDRASATLTCLHALAANLPTIPFEVIVVACHPSPDVVAVIERLGGDVQVVVAPDGVSSVSGALDLGATCASGALLLTLHDDTIVLPGFLEPLLAACAQPGVGAVHPRLLRLDGQLDCPDDELGARWDPPAAWAADGHGPSGVRAALPLITGATPGSPGVLPAAAARTACLLLHADAIRQAGGFHCRPDHQGGEMQLADRIRRAGWIVRYVPAVAVVHRGDHAASPRRWGPATPADGAASTALVGPRSGAVGP